MLSCSHSIAQKQGAIMSKNLTPKQVAQAIGVSESSVKRWCDGGKIPFHKTAGGHRRLDTSDVLQFCRSHGQEIATPELLGLPSNTGQQQLGIRRASSLFVESLVKGDEDGLLRILLNLYLAGFSVPLIGDMVVAPAFTEIGSLWSEGSLDVFEERLGSTSIVKVMARFCDELPSVPPGARLALGASLEGDHYAVANSLVEACFKASGWRAIILGSNLPMSAISQAITKLQPKVLWLSVGADFSARRLKQSLTGLAEICARSGVTLAVGGRGVDVHYSQELVKSARYFPNLQALEAWAKSQNSKSA
jgi:excisionase family DNA binding protein